ncbi:MAG TPA: Hsp70 family protein [Patescibacteria group bacterium]|nr:Hsp70 family protein [Patescibacteria group bacterium]
MHPCGIDFGTSNSAIALGDAGGARLLKVEGDSETLPSAIFYAAGQPKPTFGRAAQKLFFEGEEGRFMRSLKRILGTSLMNQGTVVNGKPRGFDEIIGQFIGHIKKTAEQQLKHELTHAVMGRPVHFIDGDPDGDARAEAELQRIAASVGFRHIAFQFEPVAAAFAHEVKVAGEKRALVADVGGGTSDFTVIKVSRDYIARADRSQDILGHSGVRIGGNDFDKSLSLASFMPAFGYRSTYGARNFDVPLSPFHDMSEWSKVNFLYTPKVKKGMRDILGESHAHKRFGRFVYALEHELGHRILSAVESAKIELTRARDTQADLGFIEQDLSLPIARARFDDAITAHVDRISDCITECLARAQLREEDIEIIILTGGPTETPLLKQAVCARFPNATLSEENKLSSVALGLGYDSQRKFGN